MSSRGDFERLPMIDVSGLESADLGIRRRTALELDRAARSSGFFYAAQHGFAPSLIEGLEAAAAEFFALPEPLKQRYRPMIAIQPREAPHARSSVPPHAAI